MPKSLKLPVWLMPQCLTHKSFMPRNRLPKRSAQKRFELPSKALTISSSSISGNTHSFLDQTPDPYGQVVLPTRESNRERQYCPSNWLSASMSCSTSSSPPERLRYTISSSEYHSSVLPFADSDFINGTYLAENNLWVGVGAPLRWRRASSRMFSSGKRWWCWRVSGGEDGCNGEAAADFTAIGLRVRRWEGRREEWNKVEEAMICGGGGGGGCGGEFLGALAYM
ncbi:hypothetical protein RJ639_006370 [Escallonia herrerae]|uniref:Uncharacterized protein n=1 Tax=Escallonia herrerae TaxID=1293975 RepID=A0AA89AZB1_9ASTE|nr:hypothetical protein RJ639_006370 [Escallonia herrerae]